MTNKPNNVTSLVPAAVAMQAPLPVPQYGMRDLCEMAQAFAYSRMFGVKDEHQALSLLMIAQANGQHPAKAMQDYDVIHNRPAKKAEAMHRDFLAAGGKVTWHRLDDECAEATFSHPDGGEATISWDDARVKKAGLTGNHTKYPRQMKRARVISEGVKTIFPAATSGMYVPEEVREFDPPPMKDVTPPKGDPELSDTETEPADLEEAKSVARLGAQPFRDWWTSRRKSQNAPLMPYLDDLQGLAQIADTDTTGFDAPPPPSASEQGGAAVPADAAPPEPSDPLAIPDFLDRAKGGPPKTRQVMDDETGEVFDEYVGGGP